MSLAEVGRPDDGKKSAHIATRAPAPRPRRLSRKVIIALSSSAAAMIAGAIVYGFGSGRKTAEPTATISLERGGAVLLDSAPTDYVEAARRDAAGIGPPRPGGNEESTLPAAPDGTQASDQRRAELQQHRAKLEAVRKSGLFTSAGQRGSGIATQLSQASTPAAAAATSSATPPQNNGANTRRDFLKVASEPSINSGRLETPSASHMILAGSTIAAALMTGLSSDLPGHVIAQVTEDVFDSVTGQTKLIPQGARLIGSYDEGIGYGQTRALLVWTRLILPDGRSIALDRLIATDATGKSGLSDKVDNHWGAMVKAGALSTLLGIGSAITELGENGKIANAIRDSAGQTIGRAGDRIVEKQLGVAPTLTVRPGARVRVLVSRDLVLEPWTRDR